MGNITETIPCQKLEQEQEERAIEDWKVESQPRDVIITVPSKEAYDKLCLWIIRGRKAKALDFKVVIREEW